MRKKFFENSRKFDDYKTRIFIEYDGQEKLYLVLFS